MSTSCTLLRARSDVSRFARRSTRLHHENTRRRRGESLYSTRSKNPASSIPTAVADLSQMAGRPSGRRVSSALPRLPDPMPTSKPATPNSTPAKTVRRRASTRTREFAFFLFLNLIGFTFFSLVLDNSFWHGDDWNYLLQALRIGEHWHEIFSTRLHQTFQPIPNLIFFLEFKAFHVDARAYYLFNIFVHSINAFLVYLLVRTMLQDRTIAVLSGLLFEFAVGNFGKSVMTVSGISDLIITTLTLTTMIYYIKNELEERGALWKKNFILCLIFFTLSMLSKTTSFSLLGLMLAFNLFYREETGRRVFDRNFTMFALGALVVMLLKLIIQGEIPGADDIDLN